MNQNYDILFSNELKRIQSTSHFTDKKPKLLLHVCCAPCSSAVLEQLVGTFNLSIYFYNPNIHPEEEYNRRLAELENFIQKYLLQENCEVTHLPLIQTAYTPQDFFTAIQVDRFPQRKTEPERGSRCQKCYHLRLQKTALLAVEKGYDYFTTALSISPHKDAKMINTIGCTLEEILNANSTSSADYPHYLYADFKKRNGYKRSLELSTKFGLYRQDYCGCLFSKRS